MRTTIISLLAAFVAACGGSSSGTSCDDATCDADCVAAGFSAGVCVEHACQCSSAPATAGNGTIQGTATLFGHSAPDHAGITVTVSGTSITTTTAGDGSYTLANVPGGEHTLTFSASKYIDASVAAVTVASSSTTSAPPVVLSHGRLIGALTQTSSPPNVAFYSPDRGHVFVASTSTSTPYTVTLSSVATDGSSEATIYTTTSIYPPGPSLYGASDDSVVYVGVDAGVWTRPFDASQPPRDIIPRPGALGGSVYILAISSKYVFAFVQDPTQAMNQTLVVARTDGSAPPRTVWAQTALYYASQVIYCGDNAFAFAVSDSSGTTTAIHSVDPATGIDTVVPLHGITGGNFTTIGLYKLSPDHKWALLGGTQNGVPRTLVYQVGSTGVMIAAANMTPYNGGNPAIEAMDDSSGFLYSDAGTGGYYFFGTTTIPASNPIQLIPAANINFSIALHHTGSIVAYGDAADSNKLKVVSIPTAGNLVPVRFTLDTQSGYPFFRLDSSGTRVDAVWGIGSPAQLRATSFALPMTTAPTVVSLGAPLTNCTNIIGPVPNYEPQQSFFAKAFFYLCWNTTTVYGYQPPFTAAVTATQIDTNVVPQTLQALTQGGLAYEKTDGTWWASDGATTVKVSAMARAATQFVDAGSWLFFDDESLISRASRRDGTAIDEPLADCVLEPSPTGYYPFGAPFGEILPEVVGGNIFAPTAERSGSVPDPYIVPQANLP